MKASKVVNQKLSDYIQDSLSKGFSRPVITDRLKKSGYTDSQIKEAFGETGKTQKKSDAAVQKKKSFLVWLILAVIIISAVGFAAYKIIDIKKSNDPNYLFVMSSISALSTNQSEIAMRVDDIKTILWNKNKYKYQINDCEGIMSAVTDEADAEQKCDSLEFAYTYPVYNPGYEKEPRFRYKYILNYFVFSNPEARDSFYNALRQGNLNRPEEQTYSQLDFNGLIIEDWRYMALTSLNESLPRHFALAKYGDTGLIKISSSGKNADSDLKLVAETVSGYSLS
jgi:hypothetical protein